MFSPKSILVTGGAGFIGANFIRFIAKQHTGAQIINLDNLSYAANLAYLDQDPKPLYTLYKGSVTNASLVNELFKKYDIDCVIHFAAESHVDRSISGPEVFVDTNIKGTMVLLEAARRHWQSDQKACRFHHISTDEVFGSLALDDPAFNEMTPYDPSSPYSASKAASDHLVRAWGRTYGLPFTISNCSNNYGPGQHQEKLIPTVIRKARSGEPIPIYGDGTNRRDWLYVLDHCEAIWRIVKEGKNGETYAIGGGEELSNNEVAAIICDHLDTLYPGRKPHANLLTNVKDRAGHDWRYAIDSKKIEKTLGWRARFAFSEAIAHTVAYYTSI